MRRMIPTKKIDILNKMNLNNNVIEVNSDINTFENIVDKNGHKRFIGNDFPWSGTGLTYTYCHWELSGTHLMIVIAGKIQAGATINAYSLGGNITLPEWIVSKIFPSVNDFVDYVQVHTSVNGITPTENIIHEYMYKLNDTTISIKNLYSITAGEDDEVFRIAFDLIIE